LENCWNENNRYELLLFFQLFATSKKKFLFAMQFSELSLAAQIYSLSHSTVDDWSQKVKKEMK
jgi:hypothetical protein